MWWFGTAGTASMTGNHNDYIRKFGKVIRQTTSMGSMLHINELPLGLSLLSTTTKSPDSFSGPIGKSLTENVSSWHVAANFKSI